MNYKNKIFIVSGPSGSGKTTLAQFIISIIPNCFFSKSLTTRPIRDGEVQDNYNHVTPDEFRKLIDEDYFLEYEEVYRDRYYGTPRKPIEQALLEYRDVVLEIDVFGAAKVKQLFPNRSISIFIYPPSLEQLKSRLIRRGQMSGADIQERLDRAAMELFASKDYDYVVLNDDLITTYKEVGIIINSHIPYAII